MRKIFIQLKYHDNSLVFGRVTAQFACTQLQFCSFQMKLQQMLTFTIILLFALLAKLYEKVNNIFYYSMNMTIVSTNQILTKTDGT